MSASIIVVDDEPDVAAMFRQRFRREARQPIAVAVRTRVALQMVILNE
jgi:hypothetical protein